MQRFGDIIEGYKSEYKPFELPQSKTNTESNNILAFPKVKKEKKSLNKEKSIPKEGVDTMRKNCYKRTDGRWQYSKQLNGLQYYAIANTYRELLDKIKNIKPKQIRAIKRVKTTNLTFIQYFQFYIDNYVKTDKKRAKTTNVWLNILNRHLKENLFRISLEKLTSEDIQRAISKITKERTREIAFQKVVKVLQKAYITGKIKKNITLGLDKPTRDNKEERLPLTPNEQKALVEKVKGTQIYPFVMFSLIVGSRREETLKFNLETDLNEQNGIIHIKGTKTKNADRNVYVTKEFIDFLRNNMKSNTFGMKANFVTKQMVAIFRELNIKNCLHGLRHTCSANLYFLGAKDKYRQMQLGHSSIVTTNNIYTNIKENIEPASLREIYGDLYPKFD